MVRDLPPPASLEPAEPLARTGLAPLPGGADPQALKLALRRQGLSVAVGRVALEHVPGDDHELAGGGHHGHVAVLLLEQAAEEDAEGAGVAGDVLGGLNQQPAGLAVAALGDRAVVAALGRLLGGRSQSQVAGGLVGAAKAADVTQGGQHGLGHGVIDAGQGHEQFDARVGVGLGDKQCLRAS